MADRCYRAVDTFLLDVGVLAFFHSLFVIVVGPLLAGAGIGALLAKAGKAT